MVLPYHISLSLQTLFFQGWNSFALAFICIQSLTMKKIGCHHFLSEKVINGIAECNYPINQSQGKQIIFGMCMVQENKYILRIILACAFYHLTLLPNQHMTLPPPPHLSIVIFLSCIFIVSLQSDPISHLTCLHGTPFTMWQCNIHMVHYWQQPWPSPMHPLLWHFPDYERSFPIIAWSFWHKK